jgi:hypothetical protein
MNNPYAPPSVNDGWNHGSAYPSEPPQTKIPKTFGVLSIIFASITLFFSLFGACGGMAGGTLAASLQRLPGQTSEQARAMAELVGNLYFWLGIQSLIFLVMSSWLLAVGIGQVKYRRWARNWTMIWGVAALIALVGVIAIAFLAVGPAYKNFFAHMAQFSPSGTVPTGAVTGMSSLFGASSAIMMLIFYAPYPILLLIFFAKPNVISAMDS